MKDVKEFSAQEIAPMIDAYLDALEVGLGRDRLDVCDHIHRRVGQSYKWHRKEIKGLADEAFKRNGWRRDREGWWWKVARPVRMKAPPARRGRMHGPKYSAKHDPMFTPEVLTTEMQETIRLNMPRLHTMDSPDVILLTGKRLDRWLDWQSPKMQDCARAAFKAAELVTRDGWFYQPPKPAPAPRNTPVRVGGAA